MKHGQFLDEWMRQSIGLQPEEQLVREIISRYQLQNITRTLQYVKKHSPFYQKLLADHPGCPGNLNKLAEWPLTEAGDIRRDPLRFLCVSQDEISDIVTLRTSGSTEKPKRLFFSSEELRHTVDFFRHCLKDITEPGQRVLILMPGEKPGSVGDVLVKSLAGLGVDSFIYGLVDDYEKTVDTICRLNIDFLIGLPAQIFTLCRHQSAARIPQDRIKSVILSADYISDPVLSGITQSWGCRVYRHYGMTEMGYGGGMECIPGSGYHLREADFFFEIIDPDTGRLVPEGQTGELVFTTLRRRVMPLVRYRTGDLAAFDSEPCLCGSPLRRLKKIYGRSGSRVTLKGGNHIFMPALDETVYNINGVVNFTAEIVSQDSREYLQIKVQTGPNIKEDITGAVRLAVSRLPQIADACWKNNLIVDVITVQEIIAGNDFINKRSILDRRSSK